MPAGPKDVDAFVQSFAESFHVARFSISAVLGRTEKEYGMFDFFLQERHNVVGNSDLMRRRLFRKRNTDVIEEQTEMPYADIDEALYFVDYLSAIRFRHRGEGVVECNVLLPRMLVEPGEFIQPCRRVRTVPVFSMIWVVLGSINISVQTDPCQIGNKVYALDERIGLSVESLNHSEIFTGHV